MEIPLKRKPKQKQDAFTLAFHFISKAYELKVFLKL
jgi:hypothetical protein